MDPLQKARLKGLAVLVTAILGGYGVAVSETTVTEILSWAIAVVPLVIDYFVKHPGVDDKIKELQAEIVRIRQSRSY